VSAVHGTASAITHVLAIGLQGCGGDVQAVVLITTTEFVLDEYLLDRHYATRRRETRCRWGEACGVVAIRR
jgi:hypothetical protein